MNRRGQGPLAQFTVFEKGLFRYAQIRDDIKPDLPQFPFRKVRNALSDRDAIWPEPTEGISNIILDIGYKTNSIIFPEKKLQIELVDYPGEWLIDFPMLHQSYEEWSEQMLTLASTGARKEWAAQFFHYLDNISPTQKFDEEVIGILTDLWSSYLHTAAKEGHTFNQPSRMLRPDTLRHSPILRLIPLKPELLKTDYGKKLSGRFEKYKKKVIKPFYKNYFSKMDRQIVLIDVLRSIRLGKEVFDENIDSLSEIIKTLRYGRRGLESVLNDGILSMFNSPNTTHVLVCPTKADHVVHGDRANLEELTRKIMRLVDTNNILQKAVQYDVIPLASIQATQDRKTCNPPVREILYGTPLKGETGSYDPGGLPLEFPPNWSEELFFEFYHFEPMHELIPDPLYQGFPSINIGKVLNFLVGDKCE